MSATIEIPTEQLQAMLDTLEASRREMTGTAKLLGTQHTAIVALSLALRNAVYATTERDYDQAIDMGRCVLEQWGAKDAC